MPILMKSTLSPSIQIDSSRPDPCTSSNWMHRHPMHAMHPRQADQHHRPASFPRFIQVAFAHLALANHRPRCSRLKSSSNITKYELGAMAKGRARCHTVPHFAFVRPFACSSPSIIPTITLRHQTSLKELLCFIENRALLLCSIAYPFRLCFFLSHLRLPQHPYVTSIACRLACRVQIIFRRVLVVGFQVAITGLISQNIPLPQYRPQGTPESSCATG